MTSEQEIPAKDAKVLRKLTSWKCVYPFYTKVLGEDLILLNAEFAGLEPGDDCQAIVVVSRSYGDYEFHPFHNEEEADRFIARQKQ